MILVDTSVVSEPLRRVPEPLVAEFEATGLKTVDPWAA